MQNRYITEAEIRAIVRVAVLELDLQFVKHLRGVERAFDEKLLNCRMRRDQKRRWAVGTWVSIILPLLSIVVAAAAHF